MADQEYKSTIYYSGNDFFTGTSPSGHSIAIDTNHQRNSAPTPLELILIALGSCTAVDVISILAKKRQIVSDYRVEVVGHRRDEMPRAFIKFEVKHIVSGKSISREAVAQAIKLSDEKYCSVAETVRGTAEIITSFEIIEV